MKREQILERLPHMHSEFTTKILENEPSSGTVAMSAAVFAQLADPTRLKILWLLCHTEECVQNIAEVMEMTSPAVSHHLSKLKTAGLLQVRKAGKETYYSLENSEKAHLVHDIVDKVFDITHSA